METTDYTVVGAIVAGILAMTEVMKALISKMGNGNKPHFTNEDRVRLAEVRLLQETFVDAMREQSNMLRDLLTRKEG